MESNNCKQKRTQLGFGLIEIMIALLLGIIIMLGVTEVATNNSRTRAELERTGRQIESASYAMRLIESDLTNAGFWGEMGEQAAGALPPVCPDTSGELELVLGYPLQGGQGEFDCLTADATDANKITPKAGTEYLVVRRANSCALGTTGCDVAGTNFHLQVNSCFDPNDDSAPKPGIDFLVDSDLSNLDYTLRDCSTTAPQYRFLNRIYYINQSDQLVRADLVGAQYEQTALVDGVEMMRLEYGLDSAGNDGQVDGYAADPNDPEWSNVAMVRVSLVVRNLQASAGFVDNKVYTVEGANLAIATDVQDHRRQLYSRTISVRNIAGRRE